MITYTSLRRRLIALSFGVSLCTLFVACVAFFWRELSDSREQEGRRLLLATRVAAQSASAAVAFGDAGAAEEILGAFKALPSLEHAVLRNSSGSILAEYWRGGSAPSKPLHEQLDPEEISSSPEMVLAHADYVHIRNQITQSGEVIGELSVRADMKDLWGLVSESGQTTLVVFIVGSLISYFLGALLSTRLAQPIKELAASMEAISNSKDYSVRLVTQQKDEIGVLFHRFNEMLEQIEGRDCALREYQQTLEARVEERTAELVRERQQLLGLIKNAPVAIAMLDNEMRYMAHSKKWREDYGLGELELAGKSYYEIFPDIPERWREIHRKVLSGEPAHASEDCFDRKDGERIYLRWGMHPWFRAEGGQGGVVMVTDRIDDLVAAREAALQTAKTRSEFLTIMSHELRTPLNGIIGFAVLLNEEHSLSPASREYVDSIHGAGKLLLALINDILDFSKLEQKKLGLEVATFQMGEVIRATERLFKGQVERKGLSFEVSDGFFEAQVRGDSLRLQQVLINLVGNAIKFTSKGSIRLGIEALRSDGDEYEALISVADTGIGIAASKQGRIFESFAQADGSTTRKYGGTGLGLAICVQLVELMGGRIWVESSEGVGSAFSFTVRLARVSQELSRPIQIPMEHSPSLAKEVVDTTGPRILVAEDNLMNQKLVRLILERAGYQVELVANGRLAIEASEKTEFAAILMDLQMPVMGGLDAVSHIRRREAGGTTHIPIVALTAHAFAEHRAQCVEAGVDGYLTKPINRQLLLTTLERFIAPKSGASKEGE